MVEPIVGEKVCHACRGLQAPDLPAAYGRSAFSRRNWRAIFNRNIKVLQEHAAELNDLRSRAEAAEAHLRDLVWPDLELGRFKEVLRHGVAGKPQAEVPPRLRASIERATWRSVSDLLIYEFKKGMSVLTGERLRALQEFNDRLSIYRARLEELEHDAENQVRDAGGVPLIGQGWLTETELFNLVKELFAATPVIQHARIPWLGNQHLDIYVPDYSLAIEYMGEQHYEPLEHFGGEEGLRKREELDARKRELCRQNGIDLVEVTPDDEISLSSLKRILGRFI